MGEYDGMVQYKYRLQDKDSFLAKCEKEGVVFSAPKFSSYIYYKLPIEIGKYAVLRFKTTGDKQSVDMKIRNDETGGWKHFESIVENGTEMQKILENIGCLPIVTFNKQRYTYKKEDFRFDLDDNDKLGHLLEVKFKPEKKDFVLGLLKKCGLGESDNDSRSILEIYLGENKNS
jgi:predicted adenylyl cyclase CyaB